MMIIRYYISKYTVRGIYILGYKTGCIRGINQSYIAEFAELLALP